MLEALALLRIYDDQVRGEAELVSAIRRDRYGPLLLGTFLGGSGFVGYVTLTPADDLDDLVGAAVAHFAGDPDVNEFEWKTRGHDPVPELDRVLRAHGLVPDEVESVMLGEASAMAVDVPVPDGVVVRGVEAEADVRRMCSMQAEVFEDDHDRFDDVWHRFSQRPGELELWVAERDDVIISAGRLEPVVGTEVASIWGGCTRPEWRGRGIYRALTAERARSALDRGIRYLHSDSTPYSRPILERSGFLRITTTTPYEWFRGPAPAR